MPLSKFSISKIFMILPFFKNFSEKNVTIADSIMQKYYPFTDPSVSPEISHLEE